MRYVSVCSGMEAATVAWHPLGWTPLAFSEIEPFPKALLQHKYPNIPNYGDLTKFDEWPLPVGNVDLVVGGTPCQAWSVAGKRLGLDDPRGRVALAYAGLIEKHRPRWIVWENVPGVYSAGKPGGADFAAFVGTLVKFGYHIAYRTLNAEYFGVPQRRRRCILVGYLGDWRPAAAVLFESESLRRDIKKGRKKGEGITSGPQGGPSPGDRKWPADKACTLNAAFGEKQGLEDQHALGGGSLFVPGTICMSSGQANAAISTEIAHTLNATHETQTIVTPVCATGETTHCLTSSHRGSEDGTGRGTPIVCATGSTTHALTASSNKGATEDGTGRGTPIVIDRAAFNQGVNAQYAPHIAESETMDTLISKGPHAVGVPFRKAKRASTDQDDETWVEADKANTLNLFDLGDTRTTHAIVEPRIYENHPNDSRVTGPHDVAPTVTSRYGTGGGNIPLVNNEEVPQPIAFQPGNLMRRADSDPSTEVFPTVKCDTGDQSPHVAMPVVPLDGMNLLSRLGECGEEHSTQNFTPGDPSFTLRQGGVQHGVLTPMAVRRLTPEECEALQGFPKGYSKIPWKGKPADQCPDGPRYKACGNSMAVPVMRWVGERIALVDKLISQSQPEQPKP
jgi:DNA (cytosine-5)-methyltransferase 1